MKFLKWLFSWKTLRRLLLTVAVLVTLAVALLTLDAWRGKRAWLKCKAELEAKGEVLDWKAFIPPPIPDEQNFAATPLLREIFTAEAATRAAARAASTNQVVPRIRRVNIGLGCDNKNELPSRGDLLQNQLTDLAGWARFYTGNTNYPALAVPAGTEPAKIVLAALANFDAELAELQAASARPQTRYDINYDVVIPFAILLPHYGPLRQVQQVLMLRATARLADGKSDAAFTDLKLMLRLADSTRPEGLIIAHLIRNVLLQESMQVVQEGLARHAWNDAQLTEIERTLVGVNVLANMEAGLRGERAGSLASMDALKKWRRSDIYKILDITAAVPTAFVLRSVVDFNKESYARMMQEYFIDGLDLKNRRVNPRTIESVDLEWARVSESLVARRRYIFTAQFLPAMGAMSQRSARMQTAVDQVRLACALERYRLARGSYPDALAALVPAYLTALPHDLVTGGPLVYRREGDTGYILYALGWNATDDGGTVVMNNQKPPKVDLAKGDWVWRWPAK